MSSPTVSQISIYPFKSFDAITVKDCIVLPSGALLHDRQLALVDSDGKFINAKRTSRIHQIELRVDPESRIFSVGLRSASDRIDGHLDEDGKQLSDWLTDVLSIEASIVENELTGFPDDMDATGPTIVSLATLEVVASWFPDMTLEEVRRRFRANIEVSGVEAFWEDRLFQAPKLPIPFFIGSVQFGGTNPCQRCVVPTRDSLTGEIGPSGFAQQLRRRREATLPEWAAAERFDHFYRLCTNTQLWGNRGGRICVGDQVLIQDPY